MNAFQKVFSSTVLADLSCPIGKFYRSGLCESVPMGYFNSKPDVDFYFKCDHSVMPGAAYCYKGEIFSPCDGNRYFDGVQCSTVPAGYFSPLESAGRVYYVDALLNPMTSSSFPSQLTVLYDERAPWEEDYILRDVLPPSVPFTVQYIQIENLQNISYFKQFKEIVNNNVFVMSMGGVQPEIMIPIVEYLRPRIIIHVSDESGDAPQFLEMANYCSLYLRQHNFALYESVASRYTHRPVVQMPLGYMTGMFGGNQSTQFPDDILTRPRSLAWSFVGNYEKQDRPKMIKTMKKIEPHYFGPASPVHMRDIYLNSIFTPNGRGWVSLNCFRLYEASACGSIPVVVGSKEEIEVTFRQEKNPPWLFARNWKSAMKKVKRLLKNEEALLNMRSELVSWWKHRMEGVRQEALNALLERKH